MAYSLKLLYSKVKYHFNAILHDFNILVMMYKRWSLYDIFSKVAVLQSEVPFQCDITLFHHASHDDRGQCRSETVTSFIHCDVTAPGVLMLATQTYDRRRICLVTVWDQTRMSADVHCTFSGFVQYYWDNQKYIVHFQDLFNIIGTIRR